MSPPLMALTCLPGVDPASTQRLLVSDYDVMYYSGDSGATLPLSTPPQTLARVSFWRGFLDAPTSMWGPTMDCWSQATMAPTSPCNPCRHQEREVIVSFAGAKTRSRPLLRGHRGLADAWAGVSGCELYGRPPSESIAWISGQELTDLTANLPSGKPRPSWHG